jgi:sugar transferase (PEP-CTERM/EpsH1 system associated)
MKILMLIHRFPYPPVRGDCIRSWGELEFLARRHDVWLACVDRVSPRPEHLTHVRALCRDVAVVVRSAPASAVHGVLSLLTGRSLTVGYFSDERLVQLVRDWGRQVHFDAVLTFSPAMAPYATIVPARRRVLDMNDLESDRWASYARRSLPPLRWLYAWEARRLPRAEAAWIRAHDATLLVNERERRKLPAELLPRCAVVHTGVDLSRYTSDASAAGQSGASPSGAQPVVSMLGSMSYPPNVRAVNWFGRQVWPRVQRTVPEARWLIVGRDPVRSVRRWGRQPNVTVTGFVEDVRSYLWATRVFVCPAREQIGVQTKLIEALAAGRAAVVTPHAAGGIEYDDPPPFLVAASPREFADAVVRLLRDDATARALGARARAVACANYAAEDQYARIERWLAGYVPDGLWGAPRETVSGARNRDARPVLAQQAVQI